MARGVDGKNIYTDDSDRRIFLSALNRIAGETGATLYAYCLMSNHFHFAIKVDRVPLARIMQRILTSYSITFNQRSGRTGHLFQARYKALVCVNNDYLLKLIAYIQMNPVRAGLVERPDMWPWSSRSPLRLPNLDAVDFDPWLEQDEDIGKFLSPVRPIRKLSEIGASVCREMKMSIDDLRSHSKLRQIVRARSQFVCISVREGHKLAESARWLTCSTRAAAYYLTKNLQNC